MAIDDQACHLVGFVGNDRLVQELLEWHVCERDPRSPHLFGALGCDTGKTIAGTWSACLGQEIAKVVENVGGTTDRVPIGHVCSGPVSAARQNLIVSVASYMPACDTAPRVMKVA